MRGKARGGRRMTFPTFEIADCPSVSLKEIRERWAMGKLLLVAYDEELRKEVGRGEAG